ncbi:MAG: ribonuclease HI [Deltaproteobacteria bacterium]|nr:ribonuclease HI [Deltaproteobacteria bacterium]
MPPSSIIVFADGACLGNPGPGGWGAVILLPSQEVKEIGGYEAKTTNNRMELTAVEETLKELEPEIGDLTFHLDSSYVLQGITNWVHTWVRKDWKNSGGHDVANRDLWEKLLALVRRREHTHRIFWKHIYGHSGVPGNERADAIASTFAAQKRVELWKGPSKDYDVDLLSLKGAEKQVRSKGKKAYSYLSLVDGVVEKHTNWEECAQRVKGVSGAKFKKALSAKEEQDILRQWGLA